MGHTFEGVWGGVLRRFGERKEEKET